MGRGRWVLRREIKFRKASLRFRVEEGVGGIVGMVGMVGMVDMAGKGMIDAKILAVGLYKC